MPKDHVTGADFRDGRHRLFEFEMRVEHGRRSRTTVSTTHTQDAGEVRSRDICVNKFSLPFITENDERNDHTKLPVLGVEDVG